MTQAHTYPGGGVRYGYALTGARTVEPHPREQATIALARAAQARGLSLRRIGGVLSRLGHAPRRGGAWNPCQIKRMLAP